MTDLIDHNNAAPDGITVQRLDHYPEIRWLIHDRNTGRRALVEVDPQDHLADWTPPAPVKWWHWIEPLGAALDTIERNQLITRMDGKQIVNWDAVMREGQREVARVLRGWVWRQERHLPKGLLSTGADTRTMIPTNVPTAGRTLRRRSGS